MTRLLIAILICLAELPGYAMEVDRLEVDGRKGSYTIDMSFRVSAPAASVIAVLTDFGYPDRLNPDITAKEILAQQNGITRIHTEFEGCVLFFCRATAMTQDVTVDDNEIRADTVPDGGDFESGTLTWRVFDGDEGGSRIEFQATVRHRSFVLPFIGEFFVAKRLKKQLLRAAENLEVEAAR